MLIILLIYLTIFILQKKINKFKSHACICTLGKEENKYIREWVEHYKKYGIDKIFLYDNNNINGERFETVIHDYIEEGFVEVLDWRGQTKLVYKVMNDCYNKNNKNYDWLLFYELDEFIHLSNILNIKDFLKEKKFVNCQIIYLNLIEHDDNNQLFYNNRSLFERFPNIVSRQRLSTLQLKMIIKGNIKGLRIKTTAESYLDNTKSKLKTCDGFGHQINIKNSRSINPDYHLYYIDHFFSKSTEEFINKLMRGDIFKTGKELEKYKIQRIKRYFKFNNFSFQKIEMLENSLKLNLNQFKKRNNFY